jgi:uncharacterized phage infection (PIP) family protein YhgE
VEEQTATTNEIARNVQEAASGGGQVAENIVAVAQAAKGTTQGANDARTASGELARMATELQKVVARFSFEGGLGAGAADFDSTSAQAHIPHLTNRLKSHPGLPARVQ